MDTTKLKAWFREAQRDLPWRSEDRSPYAVWVSEMMLQQTQVAVVIPYFERWMKRFPTIQHLAEATLDEVIKMWEGLGYYSRARYLHEGARHLQEKHGGQFPSHKDDLEKIKGLGAYTCGAIRSFAFKQKTPAVDGNVLRVLSRYFMIEDDIAKPKTVKKIWQIAEEILPENEPWIVNEALIELGATVCTKKPTCLQCPMKRGCRSYAQGAVQRLPFKSIKSKTEYLYRAVAVVKCGDRFLVKRGKKGEIMSDLYEFPYFEIGEEGIEVRELQKRTERLLGCKLKWIEKLEGVAHSFTRYRVRLTPHVFASEEMREVEGYEWLSWGELQRLAFSSGHRRVLVQLCY